MLSTLYANIPANGTYTVESPKGAHRTYRIRTEKDRKTPGKLVRIVGLLVGTNNETDFDDFALIVDDGDRRSSFASIVVYRNRRADGVSFPFFRIGRGYSSTLATARRAGADPALFGQYEKHAATLADVLADDVEERSAKGDSLVAQGFTVEESRLCRRCNRKLTTPDSVRDGIGPECSSKEGR